MSLVGEGGILGRGLYAPAISQSYLALLLGPSFPYLLLTLLCLMVLVSQVVLREGIDFGILLQNEIQRHLYANLLSLA